MNCMNKTIEARRCKARWERYEAAKKEMLDAMTDDERAAYNAAEEKRMRKAQSLLAFAAAICACSPYGGDKL